MNPSETQFNRFQSPVVAGKGLGDSSASYGNDDTPIKSTGVYQVPGAGDEYLVDDYSENEEAPEDEGLMAKVVDGFHILLEKQRTKIREE